MEISVCNRRRWSVLVVVIGLSLSTYSIAAQKLRSPISSLDVRRLAVISISTSKTTQEKQESVLRITRRTTVVGESQVGDMTYNGGFICYTLEHESVKIPAGTYKGELRWSERFQEYVPYIQVPSRSGIEIHVGNCPRDSGGCILVGEAIDGACLDNSRMAFERMMEELPQTFTVIVE
jgi:hypothetical protein